jgi:lysophospholipase
MFNGSAINDTCVIGFDQAGFAIGSSGSAWNLWLLEYLSNNTLGQFAKRDQCLEKRQSRPDAANPQIISLIDGFEQAFNLTENEVLYGVYPNPFQGYNNSMINETTLSIVDGSESGQTIPLWPIIQPAREVDFIIAWDASGETPYGWQNGTNIIDTYNAATAAGLKFPKVPNAQTFIDFQYNQLPVFFGCYEEDVPLVPSLLHREFTLGIVHVQRSLDNIYQLLLRAKRFLSLSDRSSF